MFISIIASFLLLATSLTVQNYGVASPIGAESLIIFNPPITFPKAGTVWVPGTTRNVTWDTSRIPNERRGSTGLILLGYSSPSVLNENLDIAHPLASSFAIEQGHVLVTLPKNTKCRDDYFIVLFGDSGNKSPRFKVQWH